MKFFLPFITALVLAVSTIPALAQTDEHDELPPFEMLPKIGEIKHYYPLPFLCEWKVLNENDSICSTGVGKWIDMTALSKGEYIIQYADTAVTYQIRGRTLITE
jgi:hypothetical protein